MFDIRKRLLFLFQLSNVAVGHMTRAYTGFDLSLSQGYELYAYKPFATNIDVRRINASHDIPQDMGNTTTELVWTHMPRNDPGFSSDLEKNAFRYAF